MTSHDHDLGGIRILVLFKATALEGLMEGVCRDDEEVRRLSPAALKV